VKKNYYIGLIFAMNIISE